MNEKLTNETESIDQVSDTSEIANPLTIALDDATFLSTLRDYEKEFDNYASKINLKKRQEENKKYLFGRQYQGKKVKDWEEDALYLDNIIYESESYIGPMAVARLPDIIVKPGSETPQSKDTAIKLSKIVTSDLKSRERKRVLKLAFKQEPVYLYAVIKGFWDPTKGKGGDYNFKVIHPGLCKFDITSASNESRDLGWFVEEIERSVKELIMMFPSKKADLIAKLKQNGTFNQKVNENSEGGLNTKLKCKEVWFSWYKDEGSNKYSKQINVAWTYDDIVFDKMLSPNWDWQGEQQVFSLDTKKVIDHSDFQSALAQLLGGNSQAIDQFGSQTVYKNFMDQAEIPYIVIGYDQFGESPIAETSRIEQVIPMQKAYDKRGTQIASMIERGRGKHVFSSEAGLKKEDIEELDMTNPNDDIFVKGKVNEVHSYIQPELPSPAIVQNSGEIRERIFDKMGVHGPTRGAVDTDTPATNNQISREGDFSRNDDVTDDTINYAAEKMAQWILQFIKLRYTKEHFNKVLGQDGDTTFERVHQDMVEDGMEVTIGASGTDKLKAEQRAMDMAKLQLIDPFSFFTDINASDPKGRTERLALWSDPNMRQVYLKSIGIDIASMMGGALQAVTPGQPTPQQPDQGSQQAQSDIMQIQQGQVPPPPQQVTPGYLQTFESFMSDPQGAQAVIAQLPQIKDQLLQFAQLISQLGSQTQSPPPAPATPQQPPAAPGQQAQSAGPLTANPSPNNTSKISAVPGMGG